MYKINSNVYKHARMQRFPFLFGGCQAQKCEYVNVLTALAAFVV